MMYSEYLKYSIIIISIVSSDCKVSSIEKAYEKGISAYTGERWSECISQFEEALHLYNLYKSVILNCRLKCKSQPFESIVKTDVEDLKIYEKFFVTRTCLDVCQNKGFSEVHLNNELDEKMISNMRERKPYEYLHICYFQMYALPKAASAAYTYLVANPNDDNMKKNLEYYIEQPEVDFNDVVDYQSEDYVVFYNLGLKSYKQNNWAEAVANMEEVLIEYLSSENMCRAECERQPDQDGSSEFIITISNNIASLLHCHQSCQEKLSFLDYRTGVEFLADILNHLQISYYRLDRIHDAAKSVATYLAIMPKDEDMLANKKMYSTLTDENSFVERSDIVHYLTRDSYEKELLNLFHQRDHSNL